MPPLWTRAAASGQALEAGKPRQRPARVYCLNASIWAMMRTFLGMPMLTPQFMPHYVRSISATKSPPQASVLTMGLG